MEPSHTTSAARPLLCALMLVVVCAGAPFAFPRPGTVAVAQSAVVRVPILVYHAVDDSGITWSVSPAQLDAQCRWLVDQGYTAISVRRFWRAARGLAELPPKPIILTNDDGGPSALTFARILDRHGLSGVYFVNTVSPLTPRQIRALARWGEVEAHTVSHVALSGLDFPHQVEEIARNAVYLEGITGQPVRFLAWPYGDANESATQAAVESGIVAAFGLGGGPANPAALDPYYVSRITIYRADDLTTFAAKVMGP